MIITGKEIQDLALYAGFTVTGGEDSLEQEFTILECPNTGIMDDDGSVQHYSLVVVCDGCDASECSPLGDEINN